MKELRIKELETVAGGMEGTDWENYIKTLDPSQVPNGYTGLDFDPLNPHSKIEKGPGIW